MTTTFANRCKIIEYETVNSNDAPPPLLYSKIPQDEI